MQEGRLNILTRGETRFELLQTVQTVPHLVGLVRFMEDDEGDVSATAVANVREQFIQLQRQLTAMAGGWDREVTVPDEPHRIGPHRLGHPGRQPAPAPRRAAIPVGNPPPPADSWKKLQTLMRQANRIVAEQAEQNTPFKGPRLKLIRRRSLRRLRLPAAQLLAELAGFFLGPCSAGFGLFGAGFRLVQRGFRRRPALPTLL